MTAISEQLAAKLRLEVLRRRDRVIVTRPGRDPEIMLVNGRYHAGATIGEARITLRRPGARPVWTVTAEHLAIGILSVARACRYCDDAADGTCGACERPVCAAHADSTADDRRCQPPCAALATPTPTEKEPPRVSKRTPKYDEVIEGTRVRVYAGRSEYEVIFDDDDIANPNAPVLCYPKAGYPAMWAAQGLLERHTLKPAEPAPGGAG